MAPKTFTVDFTVTERTRRRMEVQADSLDEAIKAVEEYEMDTSGSVQIDSLEFSISDVEG